MSTITGNEYDHITISDGTDQTIHYLKDTVAREDIANLKSALYSTNNTTITGFANVQYNVDGSTSSASARLSVGFFEIHRGDKIFYTSPTLNTFFRIYKNNQNTGNSQLYATGWQNPNQTERFYTSQYDGYLMVSLKKTNGGNISTSENDATISIKKEYSTEISYKNPVLSAQIAPELFYDAEIDNGDYTNAIKRALEYVGNYGTVVFSKDKTYTISSTISVNYHDITLLGISQTAHSPTIKASETFSGTFLFVVKYPSIRLQNITFEGNYSTNGVQLILDSGDVNLDATIYDCYFRHHNKGLAAFGRSCIVRNCGFSDCLIGVEFRPIANEDLTLPYLRGWFVQNCRFHTMGAWWYEDREDNGATVSAEYSIPGFEDIDSIKNLPSWCVSMPINRAAQNLAIVITDNIVDGFGYAGLYYGMGESLELSRNLISRDNKNWILCCISGGSRHQSAVISGNTVHMHVNTYWPTHIQTAANTSPIYLFNNCEAIVQDNTIRDIAGAAVYSDSCANVFISNNVFDGVAFFSNYFLYDASENVNIDTVVSNNSVKCSAETPVGFSNKPVTIASGNVLININDPG